MDELSQAAPVYAMKITAGFLIILLAIFTAFVTRWILRNAFNRFSWGPRIGVLLSTTAFYVVFIFGVFTGLGTMGINMTPILAGLGLGGFALGYAFRDALSNLLAGIMILIYQPFEEGDHISVSGCEGKVAEINLRYTTLDGDGQKFMVPNSLVLTTPLKIMQTRKQNLQKDTFSER
jgi:small conductance mechanosensitive channel